MNQRDRNELLAASLRLKPVGTPSAEIAESDAAREFMELVNTGHPGGKTSFPQFTAEDFSASAFSALVTEEVVSSRSGDFLRTWTIVKD